MLSLQGARLDSSILTQRLAPTPGEVEVMPCSSDAAQSNQAGAKEPLSSWEVFQGLGSTAEPFLGYYLIKKKDHSSLQNQPWLWGTAGKHSISLPCRASSRSGSPASTGAQWAPRACRVVCRCRRKISIWASQNKYPSKPPSGNGNSMGII